MNSNLTLCRVMELVYLFIANMPVRLASNLTGRNTATVTDWYSMCREICSAVIAKKGKMPGMNSNPIQIDEAKYNRGRKLAGDKAPESEDDDTERE